MLHGKEIRDKVIRNNTNTSNEERSFPFLPLSAPLDKVLGTGGLIGSGNSLPEPLHPPLSLQKLPFRIAFAPPPFFLFSSALDYIQRGTSPFYGGGETTGIGVPADFRLSSSERGRRSFAKQLAETFARSNPR